MSELHELYSYRNKVCPQDRSIFFESVADHLSRQKSLDAVESWITTYKEAIQASIHMAKELGITRNRTINEYPAFYPIARVGQ